MQNSTWHCLGSLGVSLTSQSCKPASSWAFSDGLTGISCFSQVPRPAKGSLVLLEEALSCLKGSQDRLAELLASEAWGPRTTQQTLSGPLVHPEDALGPAHTGLSGRCCSQGAEWGEGKSPGFLRMKSLPLWGQYFPPICEWLIIPVPSPALHVLVWTFDGEARGQTGAGRSGPSLSCCGAEAM